MSSAIVRIKKHKAGAMSAVSGHNRRTVEQKHTDPNAQHIILLGKNHTSTEHAVNARIENLGITKVRKDAVVAVEYMLSASPEYFRPTNPEKWGYYEKDRTEKWVKNTVDFLTKKHGENLVEAVLHLDEATPHIHAVVVPARTKYLSKRRTKEQIETGQKPETYIATRLDAKNIFNRQSLVKLQTDYAKALEPLGIERGLRHSRAKHTELKSYKATYAELNSDLPKQEPQKPFSIHIPPRMVREDARQNWAKTQSERVKKLRREDTKRLTENVRLLNKKAKDYEARYLREKARTAHYKQLGTPEEIQARIDAMQEQLKQSHIQNERLKVEYHQALQQQKNELSEKLKDLDLGNHIKGITIKDLQKDNERLSEELSEVKRDNTELKRKLNPTRSRGLSR